MRRALVLLLLLVACGQEADAPLSPVRPLTLTPARLGLGATHQMLAWSQLENGRLREVAREAQWTSSDPSVATVENGRVTGLREGTVSIAASIGSTRATASVTVGSAPVKVTTTDYNDKSGIDLSVGMGPMVLAEIDTGSEALVVEQGVIGPGVELTDIEVTIRYNHGTHPRTGFLAYGPCSVLEKGQPVLTTSGTMPMLVVPDGVVSKGGANRAIMGLKMESAVSLKLFFPGPFNQMLLYDRPHHQLSFGAFDPSQFATVSLPPATPSDAGLTPQVLPPWSSYWQDTALPVTFHVSGGAPFTWSSFLDTGAASGFQSDELPSFFQIGLDNELKNTVNASIETSRGTYPLELTPAVFAYTVEQHENVANLGNAMPNVARLLFDQADGLIGFGTIDH